MSGRNYLKDISGDIPNLKLTTLNVNHAKLHNKHVGLGASLAHLSMLAHALMLQFPGFKFENLLLISSYINHRKNKLM